MESIMKYRKKGRKAEKKLKPVKKLLYRISIFKEQNENLSRMHLTFSFILFGAILFFTTIFYFTKY